MKKATVTVDRRRVDKHVYGKRQYVVAVGLLTVDKVAGKKRRSDMFAQQVVGNREPLWPPRSSREARGHLINRYLPIRRSGREVKSFIYWAIKATLFLNTLFG